MDKRTMTGSVAIPMKPLQSIRVSQESFAIGISRLTSSVRVLTQFGVPRHAHNDGPNIHHNESDLTDRQSEVCPPTTVSYLTLPEGESEIGQWDGRQ